MTKAVIVDFIQNEISSIISSCHIIAAMTSDEVRNEFDERVNSCIANRDFVGMARVLQERSDYCKENTLAYTKLLGQFSAYMKILQLLDIDLPDEYYDFERQF